jgi:ornithine cyclodeaminase/alanine dehydrogenase-like protein (mu-crystallin family)
MALIIYNDPETGYPLAVMDASEITAYRTGATSALASRCLSSPKASCLGLVGAGRQAYTQLQAHLELFTLERIKVFDIDKKEHRSSLKVSPVCRSALLPSKKFAPVKLFAHHTGNASSGKIPLDQEGAHINAVGADAPGKQELETGIIRNARVIVDDYEQSSAAGEINVPIQKGEYSIENISATLGDCITGRKQARLNDSDITIFDSTGIAIEDIAVARAIYNMAIEKEPGRYHEFDFLS